MFEYSGRPEKFNKLRPHFYKWSNTKVPAVDIDTGKLVVVMQSGKIKQISKLYATSSRY